MHEYNFPLGPPYNDLIYFEVEKGVSIQDLFDFAKTTKYGNPKEVVKINLRREYDDARAALGGDKYFNELLDNIDEVRKSVENSGVRKFDIKGREGAMSGPRLTLIVANLIGRVLELEAPNKLSVYGHPGSVHNWFEFAVLTHLHPESPHAPLGRAIWACFQYGFLPLRWKGTFPDGYLEAYAVPGWSPSEVPEACRPTSLKVARRAPAKPKRWPMPQVAVVPPRLWPVGLTGASLVAGVTEHLTRCGTTDHARALAAQVAAHAQGARLVPARPGTPGEALELTFRMADGGILTLTAQPPWSGRLTGLTPDLAQVVRVHNGIEALRSPGMSAVADWYSFDGQRFAVEWDVWYQGDEDDPEDPFAKVPLAPAKDAGGLFVLHPVERTPAGLPRLDYWSHDGGHEPFRHGTAWEGFLCGLVAWMT